MLTAHLPSGYIGYALIRCGEEASRLRRLAGIAFIVGTMFPDMDMLWFHMIDHGRVNHHFYWTHLPIFWLAVHSAAFLALRIWKTDFWSAIIHGFMGGVWLHLLLDTPVGGVGWLYPWHQNLLYLWIVPPTYKNWVWSFIFHWSFLFEVAVWIAAVACGIARWRRMR